MHDLCIDESIARVKARLKTMQEQNAERMRKQDAKLKDARVEVSKKTLRKAKLKRAM